MAQRSETLNKNIDSLVIEFMSEFASYLLSAGIKTSRFIDISQIAFYKAASSNSRFRNKRLNHSALAATTGLTRVQVRQFSKLESPQPRPNIDRIENVVRGWINDPAFSTTRRSPKRLAFGTRNAPFSMLVRKYGADVSARSVLRELIRKGVVTVRGRSVALNPSERLRIGEIRLQQAVPLLVALLKQSNEQDVQKQPIRTSIGEAVFPVTSAKGQIRLQRRTAQAVAALLADLKSAGAAASIESPPNAWQRGRMTRVRIALISEDVDCGGEMSIRNK
jgi:hypothetical protein